MSFVAFALLHEQAVKNYSLFMCDSISFNFHYVLDFILQLTGIACRMCVVMNLLFAK